MRIPSWVVPFLLRLLSLTSLTSAVGGSGSLGTGDLRVAFGLGLVLSGAHPTKSCGDFPTTATGSGTASLSQPSINGLSLDLDLFIKVGDRELKTAIMPLHLLGKKSWNVYNTDNIARVKRDEAAAAAREAAEEERMQELDAERRMQILRGEVPTPLPIVDSASHDEPSNRERDGREYGRERKRRKKAGENDTDFEMRLAREDANHSSAHAESSQLVLRKDSSAPLTDHKGHISLFPESQPKPVQKNPEAEAEAAKKKREYEDQYTMRFSNAAGFKQDIGSRPWYSRSETIALTDRDDDVGNGEVVGKDVWGNEDPRRKEREMQRLVSSDPLAMMKAGAAQVRQVERERNKWREERERELAALEMEERRKRRKRRREEEDEDDLEDFKLDGSERGEYRKPENRDRDRSGKKDREREHRRRDKESRRSSHKGEERDRDRYRSSHSHRDRHRHNDR